MAASSVNERRNSGPSTQGQWEESKGQNGVIETQLDGQWVEGNPGGEADASFCSPCSYPSQKEVVRSFSLSYICFGENKAALTTLRKQKEP